MQVLQLNNPANGKFYIEKDGRPLANMTYVYAGPQTIIIDHTDVSEDLRGKGAGKLLLEEAVRFARKNHIRIIPLCPFAKSVFEKTPGLADVL